MNIKIETHSPNAAQKLALAQIRERHVLLLEKFVGSNPHELDEEINEFRKQCLLVAMLAEEISWTDLADLCTTREWEWARRMQADGSDIDYSHLQPHSETIIKEDALNSISTLLGFGPEGFRCETFKSSFSALEGCDERSLVPCVPCRSTNVHEQKFPQYIDNDPLIRCASEHIATVKSVSDLKDFSKLCVESAKLAIREPLRIKYLEDIWPVIREIADGFERNSLMALFPLYLLRAFTENVAQTTWWKFREPLFEGLTWPKIEASANNLSQVAIKYQIQEIRPAESAFPEDRLFSKALSEIFSRAHLLAIRPQYVSWGNAPNDVDLQLSNEIAMPKEYTPIHDSQMEIDDRIFQHIGYYLLANKTKLLELINDDKVDGFIKNEAENIVNKRMTYHSLTSAGLRARCWIALKLGLPAHHSSEYRLVYDAMLRWVGEREQEKFTGIIDRPSPASTFGDHLIEFMLGEIGVFWGGSVHARLLKRWWGDELIDLLEPNQFKKVLLGPGETDRKDITWPLYNRLFIGPTVKNRLNGEVPLFLETAVNLYRKIGSFFASEASEARKLISRGWHNDDERSIIAIRKWMAALLKNEAPNTIDNESLWCFVTHEEDMVNLLYEDNNFSALRANCG